MINEYFKKHYVFDKNVFKLWTVIRLIKREYYTDIGVISYLREKGFMHKDKTYTEEILVGSVVHFYPDTLFVRVNRNDIAIDIKDIISGKWTIELC